MMHDARCTMHNWSFRFFYSILVNFENLENLEILSILQY